MRFIGSKRIINCIFLGVAVVPQALPYLKGPFPLQCVRLAPLNTQGRDVTTPTRNRWVVIAERVCYPNRSSA